MGPESCCQMAAGLTKSRGGNVTQLSIAAGIRAIGSRHQHPSETQATWALPQGAFEEP